MMLAPDREATPEVKLGYAILSRAVIDLFVGDASDRNAKDVRKEALRFLTDAKGAWAHSREEFCLIASIDPNAVRDHIIAILEGEKELHIHEGKKLLNSRLPEAQAVWEERKTAPSAAQVTREANRTRIEAKRELEERVLSFLEKPHGFMAISRRFNLRQTKARELLNRLLAEYKLVRVEDGKYVKRPQPMVDAA